ncbi:MAG: DNA replication protein DnaD, partial [Oscillospiraceae bacterium]|nr:DNA replication protein DnaD [Oscillospiraceae bacterium]
MADNPYLPGNIISMAAEAADRLMTAGSGDAALLYLYLLKNGGAYHPEAAARALRWETSRCADAHSLLCKLSLARPAAQTIPTLPVEEPPEYTSADITRELENRA